jgi:Holliday junction resolvase
MKLRIFWTLMTRRESAFTTVDGRHGYKYKRDRRQTDFPEDMLPSRAYEAIHKQFGQLDTGRDVSPTSYAEIQGHRLVEPLEAVILPTHGGMPKASCLGGSVLMPVHSLNKGKRAERAFRDILRQEGYTARRGRQYSGNEDAPDVICDELDKVLHFEVKHVEALNIWKAMEQAARDCGSKHPVVAHKRNNTKWLITMKSDLFFQLLRDGMEGLCK